MFVKVDDIVVREKRKASYHPESSPRKITKDIYVKVDDIVVSREKRKASYHPESSPRKITKVEDMFDIDQVNNRKLNIV